MADRRAKNKRWGGSGFVDGDEEGKRIIAGCHSWESLDKVAIIFLAVKESWDAARNKGFKKVIILVAMLKQWPYIRTRGFLDGKLNWSWRMYNETLANGRR